MAGLNDIAFRGGLNPRKLTPEEYEAEAAANAAANYGDFGGGLASAARGMVGSTKAYAASGLDALGAENAARGLYDSAAIDAARASAISPEIATTDQITDGSTLGRYVAGKLGGGVASAGPALLGGAGGRLLTRSGLGAGIGATAAYQPTMAGGLVQEINANPKMAGMDPVDKFGYVTGVGTAQAALEGAGPAYLANKFFKRSPVTPTLGGVAKNFGKTVAVDTALEAAGAAGSDVIGQGALMNLDPALRYDPRQTFEAAVGDAVGSTGVSIPSAAVSTGLDYANAGKDLAVGGAKNVADATARNMPGALDAGKGMAQNFADAGAMFKNAASGYLKHPELAKLVAAQDLPPELEGKSAGEINDWLASDNNDRRQAALNIAQRTVIDREATETEKATAQALLDNPNDPESWKPFADGVIAKQQIERLAGKLGAARSKIAGWAEGKLGKSKSNLERTPQDDEYFSALRPVLTSATGVKDAATLDDTAAMVREFLLSSATRDEAGWERMPTELTEAFGERTTEVLAQAYDALRRQGLTRDIKTKQELTFYTPEVAKRVVDKQIVLADQAVKLVDHYLTPTALREVPGGVYRRDITSALQHYLRSGKTDPSVEADLNRMFGANKDELIERLAALDKQPQSSLGRGMADAAASVGQLDDVDGAKVAADGETGSDANMALEEDYNAGFTEMNTDEDVRYLRKGAKQKEAFDTKDAFLDKSIDLARKSLAHAGRQLEYNKMTSSDQLKLSRVGVMDYASDTGDRTLLDEKIAAHPELTHEEINRRFFVLKNEASEVDQGEAVDVNPADLLIGEGKKGSWKATTRIDRPPAKGGNIDVSTLANGRLYLSGDGHKTPHVTSSRVLIERMWDRKKLGAFDEKTAEQTGAADKLAMFSAGLTSLLDAGGFTKIEIKTPDGEMYQVDSLDRLPEGFVIWDSNDASAKLTVGDVRAESSKRMRAEKKKDMVVSRDDKGPLIFRTQKQANAAAAKGQFVAEHDESKGWAVYQDKPPPKERTTKETATGARTKLHPEARLKADASEEAVQSARGVESRMESIDGEAISETEEMAAANEKKYNNTVRRFDEETGLEVQPRGNPTKGLSNFLQQRVAKLRAEYKQLAEQVAAYEAKEGKNAVREAALKRGHAKLAALVEQGKKLAAELAKLPPVDPKPTSSRAKEAAAELKRKEAPRPVMDIANIVLKEDYSSLNTPEDVLEFARRAKSKFDEMEDMPRDELTEEELGLKVFLYGMFNPSAFAGFDWNMLFDGMKPTDAQRTELEGMTTSFLRDTQGESVSTPATDAEAAEERVKLTGTSPYLAKDQAKSDKANKFLGRGSPRSSTAAYAKAWGELANTGEYNSADRVFLSVEGARAGRAVFDRVELGKAIRAGATVITDDVANRSREYNIGERDAATFLANSGYVETAPGEWQPAKGKTKSNLETKVSSMADARWGKQKARAQKLLDGMSNEDLHTLQNDVLARDPTSKGLPALFKDDFREWLRDYSAIEREEMMAPEREGETQQRFLQEVVDAGPGEYEGYAIAKAILEGKSLRPLFLRDAAGESVSTPATDAEAARDITHLEASIAAFHGEKPEAGAYAAATLPNHLALDQIAKAFGARVRGFKVTGDKAKYGFFSGVHLGRNRGVVYLSDASKRPHMALLGHELVHHMSKANPALYAKFEALVSKHIKPDAYKAWSKMFPETGDKLREEFMGEVVSDGMMDRTFWEALAKKDMNIAKQVYASVMRLFKQIMASVGYAPKTKSVLDDYAAVMKIAGEVMAEFGATSLRTMNESAVRDTTGAKFSLEDPAGKTMTDDQKAEVSSYIEKTLGPKVAVFITGQLKGSGEWSRDAKNQNAAIKIAATALNPLSVAHHESMHEFFQRLLDGKYERAAGVLRNAASSKLIQRQLERHFAGQTEVLNQIETDVEERIAYMFQLWAAGKLDIGTQTETVFRKIINVIRKTLGLVSQEKQLEEILQSFYDGKMAEPSAMAQVLDSQEARAKYLKKIGAKANPALKKANEWVGFAENALTGNKNPHLDWVGRLFNNKTGSRGDEQGFLSAKEQANNFHMNEFANALKGIDPTGKDTRTATKADVDLALEGLQTKTWHADPVVLRVQQQVDAKFQAMMQYMKDRGVKVFNAKTKEWDDVREIKDYRIPVSWDPAKIIEESGRVKELLLEHHEPALTRIAKEANDEIADGKGAGKYTASFEKLANGDKTAATAEDVATAIVARLINSNGQQELKESATALGFSPFAKSVNERTLDWIDQSVFAEFQEKDIVKIISSYVGQVTKRGEYSHSFGADGKILQEKMDAAMDFEIDDIMETKYGVEGALKKAIDATRGYNAIAKKAGTEETTWQEQLGKLAGEGVDGKDIISDAIQNLEPARRAIMAMEGTLGHDISALARKASAYTIVYQNVRLLGYALFSNVIDPLGMMVRGAEFKDAYAAFKRGMRDVGREWGGLTGLRDAKDSDRDDAVRVAEMIGTVDSSGFMSQMGTIYGSQYLPAWAKSVNDTFFRWNGLEAFNRAMRVQATQAAISFIKRHYEKPNDHSVRYFEELGLSRADVQLGPDGALNVDNRKVQQAVMRWVDGAILRPNAAIRPTMSSDPHYAVFYHLKQFMYAMHAVILKRVQIEIKNGNTDPLILLMAGYVPVMLAADAAKGLIQEATGGGAPYWQHDTMGGILAHGVQRAGLLGVGQIGVDVAGHGPADLFGPMAGQAADLVTQPLGESVAEAVAVGPMSMLTKGVEAAESVKGEAA